MWMKSRAGKVSIKILLLCVLGAVGIGAGSGAVVMGSGLLKQKGKQSKSEVSETPPATVHSLGEMVVNLADRDNLRYAKVTVAVGFPDAVTEEQLKELDPLLRDAVIDVLTERTFRELRLKGGIRKLKDELRTVMQSRTKGQSVQGVYLEGFAMQ